ncbi:hypothetical protein A2379_00700 [Candidatus Amesbacteria bacterium RIFOXYB1_FULL_47_13]|nr:MAG: hypothetical protein A2379_00700 [Candidatus Amesbacteria bacterium RIFOXYB1_FULL_47_13]
MIIGIVVVLGVAVAGVLFATRGNNPSPEVSTSMPAVTETTPAVESAATDSSFLETASVTVEGGNFYFQPNEIRAVLNEPLKIILTSKDGIHDFVIDEFNVKTTQIKDGETAEVEFIPDRPGTYEFYCSVGQHRVMGMKGTLIVE